MNTGAGQILWKAKRIKVVAFDTIGVLFSSTVSYDKTGEVLRTRSHVDGQGISLLRAAGIRIVFMSASDDGFIRALGERFNSLPSVQSGAWPEIPMFLGITGQDKANELGEWLRLNGFAWEDCAYMGDDIGDYQAINLAGFSAAPSSGEELIKDRAHFIAGRRGGEGAVRDLCDLILNAKKIDVTKLALK